MTVTICDNQAAWDSALMQTPHTEFLQSWGWGEFQKRLGREVLRLQIEEDSRMVAQAQVVIHSVGLGLRYAYFPRFQGSSASLQSIGDYLKAKGLVFARIEPTHPLQAARYTLHATANRQPQQTLVVDVTHGEETLLSRMHPKTRYNIHVAEKRGVTISDEKNIDIFWQLNAETTARDNFKSHPRAYYEALIQSAEVSQLTALMGGQPIASHLLVHCGDTVTYVHGASGNAGRNAMAPYLLQWKGIQRAAAGRYTWYDFWGVAPSKIPTSNSQLPTSCFHNYCWEAAHPWTGITRFKAGFGGEPRAYPAAAEIILHPGRYRLFRFAKRLRQMV